MLNTDKAVLTRITVEYGYDGQYRYTQGDFWFSENKEAARLSRASVTIRSDPNDTVSTVEKKLRAELESQLGK